MRTVIESIPDLKKLAWVSDEFLDGPPRSLVIWHHGLGFAEFKRGPSIEEYLWTKAGALVVVPYYGPWSWMNREARSFVDEVIFATRRLYRLGPEVPLISAGGSMGGCSALLLARYSQHPVAGCLVLYPVCDTVYSFDERPDVARTLLFAFRGYVDPLPQVLVEHSPLAQVAAMPDIPYCVIHGDSDVAVNKEAHSDRFVDLMRKNGRTVDYLEVSGFGHDGPATRREVLEKIVEFVASFMKK